MSLMSKYLQYISIGLFGFFVLTYSSNIQAGTNKLSMVDVVADVSENIGQTITVPGYMLSPSWSNFDLYFFYEHKPPLGFMVTDVTLSILGFTVNGVKLSKKQKKWVLKNCEWEAMIDFDGGCYVNVTGIVSFDKLTETIIIDAIEIKKMGFKDKLINIAIGEKNKLEGTVDFVKDIYE